MAILRKKAVLFTGAGVLLPCFAYCQSMADEMSGLHGLLEQLYDEMIPLCSNLIGVSQGIAGFAALWYIASRVWRHLANAEPIDFYPLFRPFVIGFCIMLFPLVLAMINGIMKPTVTATGAMVEDSNKAIEELLRQKEAAIKTTDTWQMYVGDDGNGNRDQWYKYTHDGEDASDEGLIEGLGNDIKFAMAKYSYNFRNSVKEWMSEVLRVLFEAASLCIDTLRTFQLVVLAILGPLVFGLSVFDGFHHTLNVWLARYINIFLWLPVANIFGSIIGKIQEKMLQMDIAQVNEQGDTFFSRTDVAYLVFMIIGIVGYFTVPSVANYIVHAGGGGALGQRVTSFFSTSSTTAASSAYSGAETAVGGWKDMARGMFSDGGAGNNTDQYQRDKINGNT
ncbi:conjugative transposon protein TraJ [Flavobacterium sp. RHBU_24]|uniref:conjugative transposon protein TraJ n=1 Tax=Flavobacterium sp. RHBU_24 TaxID=3391185 RepID=UPI00398486F1